MKSTETKTFSSNTHLQKKANAPFFRKDGDATFFSEAKTENKPFFSSSTIQPKLKIGQPNDKYEQEADTMADKVVNKLNNPVATSPTSTAPAIQNKCATCEQEDKIQEKEEEEKLSMKEEEIQRKPIFESNGEPPEESIQRKCATCEQEVSTPSLMTKSNGDSSTASSSLQSQLNASKGSGQALPKDTQTSMGSAFRADFSNVSIHTGRDAVQMNKELGAQAFTHGSDVYFNEGKYDDSSISGKKLIAHELTHVIQQANSSVTPIQTKSGDNDYLNVERSLQSLFSIKELLELYATNREKTKKEHCVGKNSCIFYEYTKVWIRGRGKGLEEIQAEIKGGISILSEKEKIGLLNYVDTLKNSDTNQKNWLRDKLTVGMHLTLEERTTLITNTKFRINQAYVLYMLATEDVRDAIKAEMKEKDEILALWLGVFMVFGAPAIAKGIAILANNIPNTASNTAFMFAIEGLKENQTKNIFSVATTLTKNSIKKKAKSKSFSEGTNIDTFIIKLGDMFGEEITTLREQVIPTLTNEELAVISINYSPQIATRANYIEEINKQIDLYKKNVQLIGEIREEEVGFLYDSTDITDYFQTRAVWIEGKNKKRLALVQNRLRKRIVERGYRTLRKNLFLRWVDPSKHEAALKKTKSQFGGSVDTIPGTEIVIDYQIIKYNKAIAEEFNRWLKQ